MKKPEILQTRRAEGARPRSRPRTRLRDAGPRRRAAGAAPITPAPDRGGQEGRQGRLVHLGRSAGGREDRQGVRGEISRHRGAGRAHRRRARVPAHRPGIRQPHLRGRRRATRPTPRISSSGSATASSRPTCRRTSPSTIRAEHKDPDGMFASFRVWLCVIGYNTNLVKAEDAPKSFADLLDPKWIGQDRQGASGLQRHHHDRDLPDRARPRLGLFREARQAEDHAGAVVDRSAEEARARRARRDGRRQRVQHVPAQGGAASRSRSSIRPRARRWSSARTASSRTRPIRMRRGCSRATASRRNASSSSIDVGGLRSVHPQAKEKPGRKPFAEIKMMKDDAGRRREGERGDQGALHARYSGVDWPGAAQGSSRSDAAYDSRHSPGATCSRRRTALAAATVFAAPIRAAAPPAAAVTPALIEAAKKEGKVVYYTSVDLPLAEQVAQGVRGQVSRHRRARSSAPAPSACSSASPRSTAASIHAVDVVNSVGCRAFHRLEARRAARALRAGGRGASTIPPEHKDPDGLFASYRVYALRRSATTPTW